ncbi:VanZ family protein [Streptomyces sp. AM6-12]|uniref:VanZ family protein n=1 Tax=Streptomyces sp. AM6-12 TaxID=3345149 RepID=UPI0037B75046
MLEAVFQGQASFVLTASVITVLFGALGWKLAGKRSDRPVLVGMWISSVAGVLCLTLWSNGGSIVEPSCVINRNVLEPFRTVEGRLNVAMFIPVGFLGVLVTRRALPATLIGAALSVIVETAQGAFPSIGRACDTSDLVANTSGAALGALAGLLVAALSSRSLTPWSFRNRPTAVTGLVGALVIGLAWTTSIQPHSVRRTVGVGAATAEQQDAVKAAVAQAFGDYFPVRSVQLASSPDSSNGTVIANLSSGFLQMGWPDRADVTASLGMSDTEAESGFPVPGFTTKPKGPGGARAIATAYAQRHYPWGVPHSRVDVSPVGDHAALGWLVGYRRYVNGVLMPMRLDIQVDRAGRISQLSARKASDVSVAPTVTREEAAAAASREARGCSKVTVGELMAVKTKSTWRAVWRVVASCRSASTVLNIDARTGAVESRQN